MQVQLLASSVGPGAPGRQYLTSYLIEGTVAIDAGGLGFLDDLAAQERVRHVVLTHSHLDHVASLPMFLEHVYGRGDGPVTIHASAATFAAIRAGLFNGEIWPDLLSLAPGGRPFARLEVMEPGRAFEVEGLRITPWEVDHTVPTLGLVVESATGSVAVPSDTGPTTRFWDEAARVPNLRAVFLECSFPADQLAMARLSKHLTTAQFAEEMKKLGRPCRFLAVHIKPRHGDQVRAELAELDIGDSHLTPAKGGMTYVC